MERLRVIDRAPARHRLPKRCQTLRNWYYTKNNIVFRLDKINVRVTIARLFVKCAIIKLHFFPRDQFPDKYPIFLDRRMLCIPSSHGGPM